MLAICAEKNRWRVAATHKATNNFPYHLSPPLSSETSSGRQTESPASQTALQQSDSRIPADEAQSRQPPVKGPRQTTQPSESRPEVQSSGKQPATGSKSTIRDMLVARGIILKQYAPGQHNGLTCPKCNGGGSVEKSFSLHISDDSQSATWICHRGTCGTAGGCSVTSGQASTAGNVMISL